MIICLAHYYKKLQEERNNERLVDRTQQRLVERNND